MADTNDYEAIKTDTPVGMTRSMASGNFREYKVVNGRVRRQKKDNSFPSNNQKSSMTLEESVKTRDSVIVEEPYSIGKDCKAVKRTITEKPLNILLLIVPVAIASAKLEWSAVYIFSLNFIAILPLAAVLGSATEELAAGVGETVG